MYVANTYGYKDLYVDLIILEEHLMREQVQIRVKKSMFVSL